jgi:hypothetical protein
LSIKSNDIILCYLPQGLFILLLHMLVTRGIRAMLQQRMEGGVPLTPGQPGKDGGGQTTVRSTGADENTESSIVNIQQCRNASANRNA